MFTGKVLALGSAPNARILCWRYQHVGIFWHYLTLKFALSPTPTPHASQCNIGGVGSSGVGAGIGHVHFMLFMSISFALGTQRKLVFQWNMGLKPLESAFASANFRVANAENDAQTT